ncbi:MAG: MoxR family ATPase [Deltaproteobacteria bacterium]|nr:MoxR family ATPase [Deltaproteobacteria bacterium]
MESTGTSSQGQQSPSLGRDDLERSSRLGDALCREVAKRYIGPTDNTRLLLAALAARGHVLVEGIPGIAKTTLIKTFAAAAGCRFSRVQFTPDLLPTDITGTHVWNAAKNQFELHEGPVFAQIVLADEINRAPAKTQSALLEAMQEQQVTVEGDTRPLPSPFMVLATQNPIEQEGTYPLPEAQIDRFLAKLLLGYPTPQEEERMITTYGSPIAPTEAICNPDDIIWLQRTAEKVHVSDELRTYLLSLVQHTRSSRHVYLGCSPRAGLNLLFASRALALLQGRDHVLPDDVKSLAIPVLAHRIILVPEAELEGINGAHVVSEGLQTVPVFARTRRG